jgi:hypothetical protein
MKSMKVNKTEPKAINPRSLLVLAEFECHVHVFIWSSDFDKPCFKRRKGSNAHFKSLGDDP